MLREVHPLPKVDETLAQLAGARVFSKLDANSGFWQILLSEFSQLPTTFINPVGRYCFNKLPFGISSAPEHFQRRMSELLTGLQAVQELSKPTTLALYDPEALTKVSADASSHGLGAVLYFRKSMTSGSQSHLLPAPCPRPNSDMPR